MTAPDATPQQGARRNPPKEHTEVLDRVKALMRRAAAVLGHDATHAMLKAHGVSKIFDLTLEQAAQLALELRHVLEEDALEEASLANGAGGNGAAQAKQPDPPQPESAAPAAEPLPDLAEARTFLNAWFDGCHIVTLVSITPDPNPATKAKVLVGESFMWPVQADAALDWVEIANRKSNVYFCVNRTRRVSTKPRKTDVDAILGAHSDVDPIKGRELMPERDAAPRARRRAGRPAHAPQLHHRQRRRRPGVLPGKHPRRARIHRGDRKLLPAPGVRARRRRELLEHRPGHARARHRQLAGRRQASGRPDARPGARALGQRPALHLAPDRRRHHRPRGRAAGARRARRVPAKGERPQPAPPATPATCRTTPPTPRSRPCSTTTRTSGRSGPATRMFPPPDDTPSGWDNHWLAELVHLGITDPHKLASYLRSFRAHLEESQPADERKIKDERADYVWRTVEHALRDDPEPADDPDDDDPGPQPAPDPDPAPSSAQQTGPASNGQQQTAGDAQGKNRGTFKEPPKAKAAFKPAGPEPWPEPGVLGEPPAAPLFPTDCLPTTLRRWIEEQTASMAVPACTMAVPALVSIAGAIGRGAVLHVKVHDHGWSERPCLWGGRDRTEG